jgi:hypothetical protein
VALIIHRASKHDSSASVYHVLINKIKQSRGGVKLGCLLKMKFRGVVANTWNAAVQSAIFLCIGL